MLVAESLESPQTDINASFCSLDESDWVSPKKRTEYRNKIDYIFCEAADTLVFVDLAVLKVVQYGLGVVFFFHFSRFLSFPQSIIY